MGHILNNAHLKIFSDEVFTSIAKSLPSRLKITILCMEIFFLFYCKSLTKKLKKCSCCGCVCGPTDQLLSIEFLNYSDYI